MWPASGCSWCWGRSSHSWRRVVRGLTATWWPARVVDARVRMAGALWRHHFKGREQVPFALSYSSCRSCDLRGLHIGMWRSLVARFVRDEEVAGSNPVIPTLCLALLRRGQTRFPGSVVLPPPCSPEVASSAVLARRILLRRGPSAVLARRDPAVMPPPCSPAATSRPALSRWGPLCTHNTPSTPTTNTVGAHFAHIKPTQLCKPGPKTTDPTTLRPTLHTTPHPTPSRNHLPRLPRSGPLCTHNTPSTPTTTNTVGAHIAHIKPTQLCKPGPKTTAPTTLRPTLHTSRPPKYAKWASTRNRGGVDVRAGHAGTAARPEPRRSRGARQIRAGNTGHTATRR